MVTLKEFLSCLKSVDLAVDGANTYPSYDLMQMGRWIGTRIYKRVEALDSELRASKAQESCIRWNKKPKGCDEIV
jgi:hypothetical protein